MKLRKYRRGQLIHWSCWLDSQVFSTQRPFVCCSSNPTTKLTKQSGVTPTRGWWSKQKNPLSTSLSYLKQHQNYELEEFVSMSLFSNLTTYYILEVATKGLKNWTPCIFHNSESTNQWRRTTTLRNVRPSGGGFDNINKLKWKFIS